MASASAGAQRPPARRLAGAKNTLCPFVLALDRGLEPLGQRLIGRMVAQEPPSHSKHRFEHQPAKTGIYALMFTTPASQIPANQAQQYPNAIFD